MVELATKMLEEFASAKQQTSKELVLTDSEDEDEKDPEVLVEKPKALKGKPPQHPVLAIVHEVIKKTVCEITEPLLHVEDSEYERLQSEFSCEVINKAKQITKSLHKEVKILLEESNQMPKDMQLNLVSHMIKTFFTKCLARISLHHMVIQLERKFDHKAEAKTMGTLMDYLFEYDDMNGPSVFPRYRVHAFSNSLEIVDDLTERIYSSIKYGTMIPTTDKVDAVLYEDTMQKVCCFMAVTQWWHKTQADIHTDRVMMALKDADVEDVERKKNEIKYLVKRFVTRLNNNSEVEFTLANVNNTINRLSEKIWDELQGTEYRMNVVTLVSLDTFVVNELLKWRSAADLVNLMNLGGPAIDKYITSCFLSCLIGLNNTQTTEEDRKMLDIMFVVQKFVNRLYNNRKVKWTLTCDDLSNIINRLSNLIWAEVKEAKLQLDSETLDSLNKSLIKDLVKKWHSAANVVVLMNLGEPTIDKFITSCFCLRLLLLTQTWITTEERNRMNIVSIVQSLVTRLYNNNSEVKWTTTQADVINNINRLSNLIWAEVKGAELQLDSETLDSLNKSLFKDLVKKWHSAANVVVLMNLGEPTIDKFITSCFCLQLLGKKPKQITTEDRNRMNTMFLVQKVVTRLYNTSEVKWTTTQADVIDNINRLFNTIWAKAKGAEFRKNSETLDSLDKSLFKDLVKKWRSAVNVVVLMNLGEPTINKYITSCFCLRLLLLTQTWITTEDRNRINNMFLVQKVVTQLYNTNKKHVTMTQECDNIKRLFTTIWRKVKDEELIITHKTLHSLDKTVFNDLVKKWRSAANALAQINSQELQDYITSCFCKQLIRPAEEGSSRCSNSVRKALTNFFTSSKIEEVEVTANTFYPLIETFVKRLTEDQWERLKSRSPDDATNFLIAELLLEIIQAVTNAIVANLKNKKVKRVSSLEVNLGDNIPLGFAKALNIKGKIKCANFETLTSLLAEEIVNSITSTVNIFSSNTAKHSIMEIASKYITRPLKLNTMVELATKMLEEFASAKQQTSKELVLTDSEDEDEKDPEVLVEKPKALKGKPPQHPVLAIVHEVIKKTVCEITEPLLHVEDSEYERLQSEFSCEVINKAKQITKSLHKEVKILLEESNQMPKDMQLNLVSHMIKTFFTKCLARISLHHMVVQLERKFNHKTEAKTMGTLMDYLFEYDDMNGPSVFPRYRVHAFSNSLEIVDDLTERIYSCIKYGTMIPTTDKVDAVLYEDIMQKVCCFMAVTQWWHKTQADIHTDRVMMALKDANVEDEERKKNEIKYLVKRFVTRLNNNSEVEFTLANLNNTINRLSEKIWDELQGTEYRMNIVKLVSLDTFVVNELLKWRSAADLVNLMNLGGPAIDKYITSCFLSCLIGLNNTQTTEEDRKMLDIMFVVQKFVNRLYNNRKVKWTPTCDDLSNIINRLSNLIWAEVKEAKLQLDSETLDSLNKSLIKDLVKKWRSAANVVVLMNLGEPTIDKFITSCFCLRLLLLTQTWITTEERNRMNIVSIVQSLVTRLYNNNSEVKWTTTQADVINNINRLSNLIWAEVKGAELQLDSETLDSLNKSLFKDLVKKWHSAANVVVLMNLGEPTIDKFITSCFCLQLLGKKPKQITTEDRNRMNTMFLVQKVVTRLYNTSEVKWTTTQADVIDNINRLFNTIWAKAKGAEFRKNSETLDSLDKSLFKDLVKKWRSAVNVVVLMNLGEPTINKYITSCFCLRLLLLTQTWITTEDRNRINNMFLVQKVVTQLYNTNKKHVTMTQECDNIKRLFTTIWRKVKDEELIITHKTLHSLDKTVFNDLVKKWRSAANALAQINSQELQDYITSCFCKQLIRPAEEGSSRCSNSVRKALTNFFTSSKIEVI
ncbi:hypothetical protein PAMA_007503 [Pampus argenteus]